MNVMSTPISTSRLDTSGTTEWEEGLYYNKLRSKQRNGTSKSPDITLYGC